VFFIRKTDQSCLIYSFHVQRIREIHFGDVVILVQDEKDVEALIAEISKLALAGKLIS
jgi:ATP-dependent exoDNAse (exonuclease V) beta subunit